MEEIVGLLGQLWEVWMEIFTFFFTLAKKVSVFGLWILAGCFILPCVFVANHIYPAWTEWSEDL